MQILVATETLNVHGLSGKEEREFDQSRRLPCQAGDFLPHLSLIAETRRRIVGDRHAMAEPGSIE